MNLKTIDTSGIKTRLLAVVMLVGAILNSCTKATFVTPMNVGTIRFNASSYTIARNAGATSIVLPLSLPLEADGTAQITIDSKSTGLSSQYTIDPAIPANGFTISLAKGATQASFNITSLENFEGDITVVLKLSNATGGLTIANTNAITTITIQGKPIVLPSLTAAPTSLLPFGSTNITTVSASQSFTVTGVKLTANVAVTAPANYKVSLDNTTFSSSVNITAAAAMAAPVTVYAQFAPNAGVNQTEAGNISLSSGLLTAQVAVTGVESGNAAPGILINKDDFSYGASAGALTTASASKWSAFSAAGANAVQYVATGLTYTGYAGSGIGGALVTENKTASAEDVSWNFGTAQTGGSVYIAQLINFTSAPTTADFFASMGDGAAGATPVYYNRIYAKASGGQVSIGLARNATASTAVTYSTTNYDIGTTYLVVTRYDFATGNSYMYVLSGTIPLIEPASPAASSSNNSADPTSLTRAVIRQSTNLPLKATYDGVRVATSWKDAVGL